MSSMWAVEKPATDDNTAYMYRGQTIGPGQAKRHDFVAKEALLCLTCRSVGIMRPFRRQIGGLLQHAASCQATRPNHGQRNDPPLRPQLTIQGEALLTVVEGIVNAARNEAASKRLDSRASHLF